MGVSDLMTVSAFEAALRPIAMYSAARAAACNREFTVRTLVRAAARFNADIVCSSGKKRTSVPRSTFSPNAFAARSLVVGQAGVF